MKNVKNTLVSILITVVIFILAVFLGNKINLDASIIPSSFYMHTIMLIFGILAIYFYRDKMNFQIQVPKFKTVFLPFFFGLFGGIIGNVIMMVLFITLKVKPQQHQMLATMSPLQIFIFIFLYASICEEILFRGFFLNALKELKKSTSIILSALLFGCAHLVLLAFGNGTIFTIGLVIYTVILGFTAGIYQKKYNNLVYPILVHIGANVPALVSSILMANLK